MGATMSIDFTSLGMAVLDEFDFAGTGPSPQLMKDVLGGSGTYGQCIRSETS